jgi:LPS-assembly protein
MRPRHILQALLALLFSVVLAASAMSQSATLLADSVTIQSDTTIIASGNVEVIAGDVRLTATRIIYDSVSNTLQIFGPIVLTQGGETVFFAESAQLDQDLKNGIMRGARMVLEQQLQLAAAEISRVDGRYTQLYKAVASSCRVCANNPVPLWEIRAEKIIHDQQEQLLYFENAQLRIADVPVFFLPRLRMPDPTLKRARGFLIPDYQFSTQLGAGIRIPYFFPLGDQADITLTPYISPETNTLQVRYRQAFRSGRLQFDAAASRDTLRPNSARAYLFGQGQFQLGRGFDLEFDAELTSDPAYLLDYGFSAKDRLDSAITIKRTRPDEYFAAGLAHFRTLRGSELAIDDQLPNFQGDILYEKRFFPKIAGGQGSWSVFVETHARQSQADQVGRDVDHIGGRLNWGRSATFANGIVARARAELAADAYRIAQDSTYASYLAFFTPAIEAEVRWPLVKTSASSAAMVLEPVFHVVWTNSLGANVPNEDSTLVEFDEGNLFAISRYPGEDRYERGLRATAGLKWTRYDPQGWSFGLGLGRIYRADDLGQFSRASGLGGRQSDWLVAGQLKLANDFDVTARALFQDDLAVTKAESRLGWRSERLSLASTYSWIIPDISENRPDLTSQMTLDAGYAISRNWATQLDWRYDFSARKATRAGIGLEFSTDCIRVDLSLSRRFTSSTSVTPTTDVGISVALLGFGGSGRGSRQTCNGLPQNGL